MDQEPDVIRRQIDATRSSLTNKLEALECEVRGTVASAKAGVGGTIQSVRSTVQETVDSVKRSFDLKYQVERHPWALLGGSMLAGFVLGKLLSNKPSRRGGEQPSHLSDHVDGGLSYASGLRTRSELGRPDGVSGAGPIPPTALPRPEEPSILGKLLHQFDDEIEKVKGLAIGATMGIIREVVKQSLPQLAPEIDLIMDSATAKMGGQPIRRPLVEHEVTVPCATAATQERGRPEMLRPM